LNAQPAPTRFFFIPGDWSWAAARVDAQRRGGHLATVTSAEEYQTLREQVGTVETDGAWLGALKLSPAGAWSWITGEPWTWSAWAAGEPDGAGDTYGNAGDYLMTAPTRQWQWEDASDLRAGGYVLEVDAPGQPVILVPPQSQIAAPGENVSFTVTAAGTEPLFFQWLGNGVLLPGATNATLDLPGVQPADMGCYRVVVSNALGAVTSAPTATLELDYPERPGRLDPTFQPPTLSNGSLPLAAQARALVVQADGRILVGGRFRFVNGVARHGLARLQPDGTLDESFAGPPLASTGSDYRVEVKAVAAQAKGGVLAGGNLSTLVGGTRRDGLIRLLADGSLDETFPCVLDEDASVQALWLLPDDRAIIAGRFRSVNGLARPGLARLNADGSCDPTFAPQLVLGAQDTPCAVAVQPDGKVLLGLDRPPLGEGGPGPALVRLQPDGQLDPSFQPGLDARCAVHRVVVQSDGRILVGGSCGLVCLTPSGSRDAEFQAAPAAIGAGAWPNGLAVQPDGRILAEGHLVQDDAEHWGLLRLRSEGRLDPTFVIAPSLSPVFALAFETEGNVLVGTEGRVVRLNGPLAPRIVREPQGVLANAGVTVKLDVAARGAAPLGFQWLADGVPVPNATNAALVLSLVQARDAAAYQVVVFNREGCVTSAHPAVLEVNTVAPENVRPRLAITWPAPDSRASEAVWPVQGLASDNHSVAEVWYQLNDHPWQQAIGTTNWSAEVSAAPGTNRVRAFSVDWAGNRSRTNVVRFFRLVPSPVRVEVVGEGTVSPALHGRSLAQGRHFTVTATPGEGWLFSHWTGQADGDAEFALLGRRPALTFAMRAGLVLQAHFTRHPFLARAGRYRGLFYEPSEVADGRSGFFALTLTPGGAFSGRLVMVGSTNRFTGQFNVLGQAVFSLARSGASALQVELQLDVAEGSSRVTGFISDGTWTAELHAARVGFQVPAQPAPWAGRYTLLLPGELAADNAASEGAVVPGGDGWGTLTVSPGGQLTLAGGLADGAPLSCAGAVSTTGYWPLYVPLYKDRGALLAWVKFGGPDGLACERVRWTRATRPLSARFAQGLTNDLALLGSPYTGDRGRPILDFTDGVVIFQGGRLTEPLVQPVLLTATNRVLNLGEQPMTFRLNVADGSFRGTFRVPGAARTNAFQGVVLQNRNFGAGFFLDGPASGRVYFGPAPDE
jgi:uncharacterized delta-60 repeat protein